MPNAHPSRRPRRRRDARRTTRRAYDRAIAPSDGNNSAAPLARRRRDETTSTTSRGRRASVVADATASLAARKASEERQASGKTRGSPVRGSSVRSFVRCATGVFFLRRRLIRRRRPSPAVALRALLFIRLPTDAFPRALYPTLSIRFVGIAPSRRRFPRRVVARRSSRVEYFLIVHVPRRRSLSVARVLRVTRARTEFVAQTRRAPRSVGAFVRSGVRSGETAVYVSSTYIDLKGTIICALTLGLLYSRVYYLSIVVSRVRRLTTRSGACVVHSSSSSFIHRRRRLRRRRRFLLLVRQVCDGERLDGAPDRAF